jgi:hypothetical protein
MELRCWSSHTKVSAIRFAMREAQGLGGGHIPSKKGLAAELD